MASSIFKTVIFKRHVKLDKIKPKKANLDKTMSRERLMLYESLRRKPGWR